MIPSSFRTLIERPRVDARATLRPVETPPDGLDDCRVERLDFFSEEHEKVPTLWVSPRDATGPRPAVIALHGTGGCKEDLLPLLAAVARRGMLGVSIDGRHHGERRSQPGCGAAEYLEAILQKYRTGRGFPFLYDTVWDVLRLVDLLVARPEVRPERIGILGISKGGMETYLAAAADPRLAVAVPIIAVQSYDFGLSNDAWQARVETIQTAVDGAARDAGVRVLGPSFVRSFWDRVVPGIHAELDGPAVLPRIAPRPLLVVNGELDPRTPGLPLCEKAAASAYAQHRASDRFRVLVERGAGHELTTEGETTALDWLERWLSDVA